MTVSAIYARYSSDSQREESIEIQVDRCREVAAREGWYVGEVYADYGISGTTGDRPSFRRCIDDGCAGRYDVLLIYKLDRFARNVEVSRHEKDRLRAAGVRIVSVREGELEDTPDGFIKEGIGELFAEYYSRNLKVMIRDGIRKNAERCKASGVRIYGYGVDGDDMFVIDEAEAAVVRGVFDGYVSGETTVDIERRLGEAGVRTRHGNPWSRGAITKMLRNEAYRGTYRYAGVRVEGGMPAIVSDADFELAQERLSNLRARQRAGRPDDFLLSGRVSCLECGHSMCGTSGTGKSGRKYTYYTCQRRYGGCGLSLGADELESVVVRGVRSLLGDEATVDAMVEAVLEEAARRHDPRVGYRQERSQLVQRRENILDAVEEGLSGKVASERLSCVQARIEELDRLIALEDYRREKEVDGDMVRAFVERLACPEDDCGERSRLIVRTFVEHMWVDRKHAVVAFSVDGGEPVTLEEAKALAYENEHPRSRSSEGVRVENFWWSTVTAPRTLYHRGGTFATVISRG